MLINLIASAAVAGTLSTAQHDFSHQGSSLASPHVQTIGYSNSAGKKRLKRLLRPHVGRLKITQAARIATGDPNIRVIDQRGLTGGVYSCSYLNPRGKRTLICD